MFYHPLIDHFHWRRCFNTPPPSLRRAWTVYLTDASDHQPTALQGLKLTTLSLWIQRHTTRPRRLLTTTNIINKRVGPLIFPWQKNKQICVMDRKFRDFLWFLIFLIFLNVFLLFFPPIKWCQMHHTWPVYIHNLNLATYIGYIIVPWYYTDVNFDFICRF